MTKNDVRIGAVYIAKISGKLAPVRILYPCGYGRPGWIGRNEITKRQVRIHTAAKLRRECMEQEVPA